MDGAATARALSPELRPIEPVDRSQQHGPSRAGPASRFDLCLAGPDDDAAIRALLRGTPLPGAVRLTFEREPDASFGAAVEGDAHDVVLAREGGRLVAMAARAVADRFVDGRPARVAYLSRLRLVPGRGPSRTLLDAGFAFLRSAASLRPADLYLASVGAEHASSRRLLEGGRHGGPRFLPVDRLATLAVSTRHVRTAALPKVAFVSGAEVGAPALAAFLWRANARFQFAPSWNAADLVSPSRARGLRLDDVLVAVRGGAIAGCLAVWDQRAFKQVVVRGYAPALGRMRPLVNLLAPLTRTPKLPRPGAALRVACLSHLALEPDEPDVLLALVGRAAVLARARGLDTVLLGLSARHLLLDAARRRFVHREYATVLYAADAKGGEPSSTWSRCASHPEIAIL